MEISDILLALAIYIVCTVALLPGLALTIAYGGIFGLGVGGALSLVGATIGASIATSIARWYLRHTDLALLLSDPEPDERALAAASPILSPVRVFVRRLFELVHRYGARTVVITRLTPIIPFNILNYLLGLTTLPLWRISALSFICMAPACFVYAWIGDSGANILRHGDPKYLLYFLSGIALLWVLRPISRWLLAKIRTDRSN